MATISGSLFGTSESRTLDTQWQKMCSVSEASSMVATSYVKILSTENVHEAEELKFYLISFVVVQNFYPCWMSQIQMVSFKVESAIP